MFSTLLWVLAYGVVAIVTARGAYSVQRARMIKQERDEFNSPDPVERFRETGNEPAATAALVYGLAWPVVLPGFLLHRGVLAMVTARPRVTAYERELRLAASHRRIAELEHSLGLDEQHRARL